MKKEIRLKLLELYDLDIDKAKVEYGLQHYSFFFPKEESLIRLGKATKEDRQSEISRLMWADDLKQFKGTICEPIPSNKGHVLEKFVISGIEFAASRIKVPQGKILHAGDINPMFLICAGDLLGSIHYASKDQSELGMKFNMRSFISEFEEKTKRLGTFLSADMRLAFLNIAEEVDKKEKVPSSYGVCYGEYALGNMLVDSNNVWLFDFEGSGYGYYAMDVAAFIFSCLKDNPRKDKGAKELAKEFFLPWFRVGYSIHFPREERNFENLGMFLRFTIASSLMEILESENQETEAELKEVVAYYKKILEYEDIYEGIDWARKNPIHKEK